MLSVQTPAKINLFLNIRPRLSDGYHELCSVMQAIRLWDRLDISPLQQDGKQRNIQLTSNIPELEYRAKDNLIVKAYRLFWDETRLPPLGLKVHLQKEIPMQAGLGGGSSDAAAMLVILNHLAHAGLNEDQLRAMAAKLGSDIPFFISGGLALVSGKGEVVEPLPPNLVEELPLVVIKPKNLSIDTGMAYHRFASGARYETRSPEHILMALKEMRQKRRLRDEVDLESYLFNDFEKILFPEYPLLGQIARKMKEAGIRRPLLTGSGSAMIGFTEGGHTLRKAINEAFPGSGFEVFWTHTYRGGAMQTNQTGNITPELSHTML
jgi:4-diphosphocytidyl-2-C-methyl-D-erythritol kinase